MGARRARRRRPRHGRGDRHAARSLPSAARAMSVEPHARGRDVAAVGESVPASSSSAMGMPMSSRAGGPRARAAAPLASVMRPSDPTRAWRRSRSRGSSPAGARARVAARSMLGPTTSATACRVEGRAARRAHLAEREPELGQDISLRARGHGGQDDVREEPAAAVSRSIGVPARVSSQMSGPRCR